MQNNSLKLKAKKNIYFDFWVVILHFSLYVLRFPVLRLAFYVFRFCIFEI